MLKEVKLELYLFCLEKMALEAFKESLLTLFISMRMAKLLMSFILLMTQEKRMQYHSLRKLKVIKFGN